VGGVTGEPFSSADEAERRGVGADLLDQVAAMLVRYVAFPSPAAQVAVTLWTAHAHAVTAFESTPRLALLSAEKGSGKTRTLEVLELLVPRPMHAVSATAAALFRAVEATQPTLLFDEADTYFGPMAKGDTEELRALVNAGHRKGAVAYRCYGDPSKMQVRAYPAFCAVALAGIGDLPPTILDRAVLVRMRRRAPDEQVEPFRRRKAAKDAGWPSGSRRTATSWPRPNPRCRLAWSTARRTCGRRCWPSPTSPAAPGRPRRARPPWS
jgi:hypothetical protein